MKRIYISIILLLFGFHVFSQDSEETTIKILNDNYKTILDLPFSGNYDSINSDRWPLYINGKVGLDSFLTKNIIYPKPAFEKGIKGIVIFNYIITSKGEITQIRILESPNESLSEEVVRVMKLTGPWIPGINENKYTSMRMSNSFDFK